MKITYPSKEVSDYDYFSFSFAAYDEKIKVNSQISSGDTTWVVIDALEDPKKNGMQVIAVAPFIKDKSTKSADKEKNLNYDSSNIVIAFRGTEAFKMDGDKTADIAQVLLGTNFVPQSERVHNQQITIYTDETQFKTALEFVQKVTDKHKRSNISLTGHSLGGAEAQYTAAELDLKATTYAAPNVYHLLSDEAKARVDDGSMRNKVRDYTHDNDLIGKFRRGDPLIGKEYITAANEHALSDWGNPIAGHGMKTFTGMFKDGNIEFMMEPKEVVAIIKKLQPQLEILEDWKRLIKQYIDDDAHETNRIYKDMLRNVNGSGDYPLLSEQDVIEVFREKAQMIKGGDYYLIDVDFAMVFCDKLDKFKQELEGFLEELIKAAETTGTLDLEISNWFGGIR